MKIPAPVFALVSTAFLTVLCTHSAVAEQVEWAPAFQEDFEKASSADIYRTPLGEAKFEAGRLDIRGSTGMFVFNIPSGRDLRIEFDAMAPEDADLGDAAPGGITFMLNATSGVHHWFRFGVGEKRISEIKGYGIHLTNDNSPVKYEPEKWFHIAVQRDGRRMSMWVNDSLILDGTVSAIKGVPGFILPSFIAEGRLLIDNVKVFSRRPGHPDCCPPETPWLPLTRKAGKVVVTPGTAAPGLDDALAALNACRFEQARAYFEGIEDPVLRLTGLGFVLGHLDYYERPVYGDLVERKQERTDYSPEEIKQFFGEFGEYYLAWKAEAERHPENALLQEYLPLAEHFGRMAMNRNWPHHVNYVLSIDERVNPFFDKALLYRIRCDYWNAMEGGRQDRIASLKKELRGLLGRYPDNRILNEYAGEPVPWGEEINAATDVHPPWAAYLREAYARELAIINRFCEVRQTPEGEFGGGWADDVEMLRVWLPIAGISTCATTAVEGIRRLSDGVWTYKCKDGYELGTGDVEHSAEPSADGFVPQFLLSYGDPHFYEYNLRSAKTIKERFMAIDQRGYPRFMSSWFGADGVAIHDRSGGDTGQHTRAMKHFYWLAWYGNTEAKDWFVRWTDGWREVAMMDEPDKPYGVIPGTLWYPSGSYKPNNGQPWYSNAAYHYDVTGPFGSIGNICGAFLQTYSLTGDAEFLKPVQALMDWATYGPYPKTPEQRMKGVFESCQEPMMHSASYQLTSLYRDLTGERVYDEYTMRFGKAPHLYQIDHNIDRYTASFEKAAKSLRTNLWFWTTEVLSTDRLHLPAYEDVWGAYTGAISVMGDASVPTFGVTYDTPSPDFAAIVLENTPRRLRVRLYGFWDQPTDINLKLWRLQPGEYVLNQGERLPGEQSFQSRYGWEQFRDLKNGWPHRRVKILHRGESVSITLPPQKEYEVDLRLDTPIDVPDVAADLALDARELSITDDAITCAVHNIGGASAEAFTLALQRKDAEGWTTLETQTVARLDPPRNFAPSATEISIKTKLDTLQGLYRLKVDPEDNAYEICDTNNTIEFKLPAIVQGKEQD